MRAHYITEYRRDNGVMFSSVISPQVSVTAGKATLTVPLDSRTRVEVEISPADLDGLAAMFAQIQTNFPLADDDDVVSEMHRQLAGKAG